MNKATRRIEIGPFESIESEEREFERFLKAAEVFDRKHGRSKVSATKQLQKEGIVTKSGRLTKRYGG